MQHARHGTQLGLKSSVGKSRELWQDKGGRARLQRRAAWHKRGTCARQPGSQQHQRRSQQGHSTDSMRWCTMRK